MMNQSLPRGCMAAFGIAVLCAANARAGEDRVPFSEVQPNSVGMDQTELEEAKEYSLQGGGSGCILRSGQLVFSWGDQKQKYDIYSSTKSIGVTVLGLTIMDGKVELHDQARKYLPSVGTPPESNAKTGWLDLHTSSCRSPSKRRGAKAAARIWREFPSSGFASARLTSFLPGWLPVTGRRGHRT